jgi:hypothetical protein
MLTEKNRHRPIRRKACPTMNICTKNPTVNKGFAVPLYVTQASAIRVYRVNA